MDRASKKSLNNAFTSYSKMGTFILRSQPSIEEAISEKDSPESAAILKCLMTVAALAIKTQADVQSIKVNNFCSFFSPYGKTARNLHLKPLGWVKI